MNSEYFNNEIKQKYLRSLNKNDDVIKRIFVRSKSFEERYNIDLAEFSKPKFLELFRKNSWGTSAVFYTYRGAVHDYILWHKSNLRDSSANEKAVTEIGVRDVDTKKQFRDEYFGSYNELMDFVDTIAVNEQIDEDRMIFYRVFLSLMWFGITPKIIMELKETDVNNTAKTITVNGKEIYIGDYASEICERAIRNKGYFRRGCYVERDCSGGYLIKLSTMKKEGNRSEISYVNALKKFFNNHKDNLPDGNIYKDKQILPKNIMLSGLYYAAYEKEMKGDTESVRDILNTYYLEQNYYKWKKCYYGKE